MVSPEYSKHVSLVHEHVLKLANFKVQKVQNPHMYSLNIWREGKESLKSLINLNSF